MKYGLVLAGMFAVTAISGCTSMWEVLFPGPTDEEKFETIYADAEAARKKAASVDMEWRDTKEILAQARKAAEANDFKTAIELADEAERQGKLGFVQVAENKEFLKRVPYYNPDASPEDDLQNLQGFFRWRFPDLPDEEFANGFYALDAKLRENWIAIEEFPPYYPAVDDGELLWNAPFQTGKTYKDCFGDAAVAGNYPRWDKKSGQVVTMAMDVNSCREQNGEKPLKYGKDADMLALTAYIAFQSRGKPINVVVPKEDPRALEAYKEGKEFYFSRRGQLNLACYQCHFETAGEKLRTNVLGTALGQTSHFPAYRSKWGSMGSIQRRYTGCNKQVRAKPFGYQSNIYRNLEFFHTYMNNGIPLNGPGARF